jgi:outer membrane receptor for ferrienterochelin and colicin
MKRILSTLLLVLLVGFGASLLYAQGTLDSSKGQLAVEVLDSSGAVIQNARVSLTGPRGAQKAASDVRGQVIFYNLIPGIYSVKVEFEGFRSFEVQNINIAASQRPAIQAKMEPGAVTETVQVTETAAKVDTTTTTTGGTISDDTMANLPVARNIAALLTIAPGVANGGGTGAANPSISGASGLENQYIIDGVNATDAGYGAFGVYTNAYGSLGTGVNFDFVKEVQVKTGGFEAQYGQALGGIVNIVTHSGTNELHGALYAYTNPGFAQGTYAQPNELRHGSPGTEVHGRHAFDYGFNIGGPLIKNRVFWYGSFNPSYGTVDEMSPKGYLLRDSGVIPVKTHAYNWVGKLNFELNSNNHLEATAFGDPSRSPSSAQRSSSLLRNDREGDSSLLYGTRNWAVKYNGLYGPKTVLNVNFAWNHTYFFETPETNQFLVRDYTKPTPYASYTYSGGLGFMENSESNNKQFNLMLTRNLNLLGGHQIDIGYSYSNVGYDALRIYSGPDWTLPSATGIDPALVGTVSHGGYFYKRPNRTIGGVLYPIAYQLNRGNYTNPTMATRTAYHNAFAQDAWQVTRRLTVKAGVRWEQQEMNGTDTIYTFAGNWAPRLGFILDPTGSRRTKIFGSWGTFFEKIPQDMAVRAMSSESAYMNGYFTAIPPSQSNVVPGTTFLPYGALPTIIAGGTKAPYQEEIVGGVEHEFGKGLVLSARFVWRNQKRIMEDVSGVTAEAANAGVPQQFVITNPSAKLDIFKNPYICTPGASNCTNEYTWDDTETSGKIYGPYADDSGVLGADGIPDTFPDARRVYKALEFTAEKRFGENWSFMANYRLAKLFGNYEGLFRNDNGQPDPNITSLFDFVWSPLLGDQFKVGVLPTDRRQIGNMYANYLFKGRLNLGLGWNFQTGAPLSKLMAHPAYGNAGEVPVGGRGAEGRTPFQHYTDMRVDYRIPIKGDTKKLKLSADLFDIFNQKTKTNIDQFRELSYGVNNPDFMVVSSYHRPFYARFSARFEF